MSCALAFAAVLAAAPATAPVPVASEPFFADIVARAERLEAEALTFTGKTSVDLTRLRAGVVELSRLDMQGHVTLRERGTDGDLKCILKGISEDLPGKLAAYEAASAADRPRKLDELVALLDDNAAVIVQPPGPATPPPTE